jgi:hypothetical protein
MPLHVNDAGTWKSATPHVNDGGVWKAIQSWWVNDGGIWKKAFELITAFTETISGSGLNSTYVVVTPVLEVTSDGGEISINIIGQFDHTFNNNGANVTGQIKLQRNTTGTTYVDIGVVQTTSTSEVDIGGGEYDYFPGPFDYTFNETPGAGTRKYRVMARRSAGTKATSVSGTLSVTP